MPERLPSLLREAVERRKNNLKNSPLIPAFARTSFNADSEELLATEFHRKNTEKSVLICVNLWLIPPLLPFTLHSQAETNSLIASSVGGQPAR